MRPVILNTFPTPGPEHELLCETDTTNIIKKSTSRHTETTLSSHSNDQVIDES